MGLFNLFRRKPKPLVGSPAANDVLRERLAAYGDDGYRVRHILHYAYPEEEKDLLIRPALIRSLIANGYSVSDAAVAGGVVLQHHHSLAPEVFDIVTAELSAWFAARGWEYDGWESEVLEAEGEEYSQRQAQHQASS